MIISLSSVYKKYLRGVAIISHYLFTTYNKIIPKKPLLSSELSSDHLSSRPLKILKKMKMTENEETK